MRGPDESLCPGGVPAMGGNMMARRPRNASEPLTGMLTCCLCNEGNDEDEQLRAKVFVSGGDVEAWLEVPVKRRNVLRRKVRRPL